MDGNLRSRSTTGLRGLRRHDFAHLPGEGRPHITLCGRNSVQIHERARPIDLAAMEARSVPMAPCCATNCCCVSSVASTHLTLFADGRAIIQGTTDMAVARTLYARFVGS